MLKLVSRFAGDPNEKELNRLHPLVDEVGELDSSFKDLTDQQLRDKTAEFIGRLHAGESLDDLLPEAFAVVREASKRTTAMRHFDVQILGGIILHQGKVVEMKTGEGKTLVATLPLYLSGLTGKGGHLVTVNDYLARRDVQWMGPIYHLLGLSVGLLQQGEGNAFVYDPEHTRGKFPRLRPVERKLAYEAHITYGTNHEFGFDYLRDNLAFTLDRRMQRELHYAIVDEVDNILIDEARTPLIISGPSDEPLEEYGRFARIARKLRPEIDYEVGEKERTVILTEAGLAKVETETGIDNIYDEANYQYVHYMEQALRAQVLFHKDRDYIKQGRRIVLVDEFTGRLMPDRRLSEGLHQAIEAKEGARIRPRMMTQATITIQNYFRMYDKLAGMTGTAATEAEELDKIYGLDVMVLPTNVEYMAHSPDSQLVEEPRKEDGVEVVVYYEEDDPDEILFYKRVDYQDVIYKTEKAKWETIVSEIEELHRTGRPVLVGTTSVEKSERLSAMLKTKRVDHEVLNAKNHTREAVIISRAGEPKAVTIATNMAGRGVDIKLGGELPEETIKAAHRLLRGRGSDPYQAAPAQLYSAIAEVDPDYVRRREQVLELGGLHVLGTERHEARRIDNQLRGRAGRQGEPGSSRFYLSLEDDLMRRFGGPSVASLMDKLGVEEDIPIEHGMVSKTISGAQTKVEGYNFDIRKHLLEYDDVLNRQRELTYGRRYQTLTGTDLESELWEMLEGELDKRLEEGLSRDGGGGALLSYLNEILPLSLAPPDAPYSYQFPFLGNLTCFPPFTIAFLASRLVSVPREQIAETLLEIGEQASEAYRHDLLESAVGGRFESALDQYRDGLGSYTEFLENKIDDYVALMEEQGRSMASQDLLQYVQGVFPIPLRVKASELRGLSISEATDELLTRLENAYHQELCEKLIKTVQARIPAALKLEQIKTSDIASEQMEALLAGALAASNDEAAGSRLARMGQGKGGLLDLLFTVNPLAKIDLRALKNVLTEAAAVGYDRWAESQLEEMRKAIAERATDLQDASQEGLTRVLLQLVYAERADFDQAHKRRVSFAPRLPLHFLVLPLISDMGRDELREVIFEQLERAIVAREETWGRQELTRLGERRLAEVDGDFHEGLAEHLGEGVIRGVEDKAMGDLDGELYDQLRGYLGMREMEGRKLADLEFYDELAQHLEGETRAKLREPNAALKEDIVLRMQEYLLTQGYFEDAAVKETLVSKPMAELDGALREGISAHVGQDELGNLKDVPVAQWDPEVRHGVIEYLQARGHFVNEEKVQRFFVHETLGDVGEEIAQEACASIVRRRLEKLGNRTIGTLKGDLQESVLSYLQQRGLLVDRATRQRFGEQTLADLDESTFNGLSSYLGRQELEAVGSISALPQDARRDLQSHLMENDYFTDQKLLNSFHQGKLSDLEEHVYQGLKDHLLGDLEQELSHKLIGELDAHVQEAILRYLKGTDYFVDDDKARRFGSLTLSSLDIGTVHELEQELGEQIVAGFERRKFMNLDQETRESILNYLDLEGLFKKRKKREQFVKRSLAEIDIGIREGIAYYLGRNRLAEFRETRFSDFPDDLRDHIWRHLRENGYFVDREKEEYLEIEEFGNLDPQLRPDLRGALKQDLEELLGQRKVVELPAEAQASIQEYLEEQEYFLDRTRLAQFEALKVEEMEPEVLATASQHLGQRTLAEIKGQKLSELGEGLRQDMERYLEGTDFFLDEAKRKKFIERRVTDLDDEIFDGLVDSLGSELAQESMRRQVAEFDESDRESLRDYLDGVGHFLDQEALARFEQGTLAQLNLDKRDYEGLASWLGQRWLEDNVDQSFSDLEEGLRGEIQGYLRSSNYFLDSEKLQRFQERGFSDLTEETQTDLLRELWKRREEALREQRLADLDEETRHSVERFLSEKGFGLDQEGMAEFKDSTLGDFDGELRQGLARYLGHQRLSEIEDSRIAELDEPDRSDLQHYLGRQLMHQIEKNLMLGFVSRLWVGYLTAIEDLRQGIGLQAYGQMDPLVEYKRRAFGMFGELNDNIRRMVVTNVFRYPPQPLKLAQGGEKE